MTASELGPAATPERLADLARKQATYRMLHRLWAVGGVLVALFALAMLGWTITQTRNTTAQVRACTTPGSPCYEQLRDQQDENRAALLADIREAIRGGSDTGRVNRENILLLCRRLGVACETASPTPTALP